MPNQEPKATPERITLKDEKRARVVYVGARGGKYVRMDGKYVSVKSLPPKSGKKPSSGKRKQRGGDPAKSTIYNLHRRKSFPSTVYVKYEGDDYDVLVWNGSDPPPAVRIQLIKKVGNSQISRYYDENLKITKNINSNSIPDSIDIIVNDADQNLIDIE